MKERYGVSGSKGFIGTKFVDKLRAEGYDHTRLGRNGRVPQEVTAIIDFASYGNLYHQKDLRETYRANLWRVIDMFDYQRPFIFTSTSSVLLPHQTPYSSSKRSAEEFIQFASEQYNIPTAIVRPFSVTGMGEQKAHLIPKLINSAITGEEMPFVPGPTHDFIDVDDFVDALWIVAQNLDEYRGETFDIGTGISYTNEEVQGVVSEIVGNKPNLRYVDSMRSYDTKDWKADNSKIRSLGWEPKKTLKESIQEMVNEKKI